ncbi:MAG: hypothetical protein WBM50_14695 [Acidimicrobiales bacterium]
MSLRRLPRIECLELAVVVFPDWHSNEFVAEQAMPSNVPSVEMRAVAIDSIRRLKALQPRPVHFSHCPEYRSGIAGPN